MAFEAETIIHFLDEDKDLQRLDHLLRRQQELAVYGLYEGQRTLIAAALCHRQQAESLLVVCDTPKRAKEMWEDLTQLLPQYEVLHFPALEMIPYEVLAQSSEIEYQRLQVLSCLLQKQKYVVVTTMESLEKKLLPPRLFHQGYLELEVGQVMEPNALRMHLVHYGYEMAEQVERPGQFAARGGIFDVYSACYAKPLRLEFFDDEIDSLRFFNVEDQRSVQKVQKALVVPGREFFVTPDVRDSGLERIREEFACQVALLSKKKNREPLERLQSKMGELSEKVEQGLYFAGLEQYQSYFYPEAASLLDYLSKDCLVVLDEANRIQEAQEYSNKERSHSFAELLLKGSVLPGQQAYFHELNALAGVIQKSFHLCFSLLPKASIFQCNQEMHTLDCQTIPSFFGNPQVLVDELRNWQRQNYQILILLTSAAKALRLQKLLEDHDLLAAWVGERYQASPGQIFMAYGNISHGARFSGSKLVLLSETEVFQQQKKRVTKKMFQEDGQKIHELNDLKIGDYVVHVNHGIGRYMGIERMKMDQVDRDYLIVKYSGEDKLYVPVEQLELLQKYVIGEGAVPKVNKLGSAEWQKTKNKVKASVEHLAEELLQIYARRQSQQGFAFSPDDQWQKEFEDAFPYVETEDQLKAIEDVKQDMMKPMVMDRLICGDVGYGKTEVAIRAAFKAVNDGKQVAVLVPTTVLAQQHYNTFEDRFSPYGVKVSMLSRFCTAKQQRETIKNLNAGTVDIVIGTHKLLNKSVVYHDLGLLIIDEEQRFGVTHKEKIKAIRTQVDVLTMSATPIPRTLHMSMVGIRDMSVIETPPQDRYPIQTYVAESSPEMLKDAIRRELGRGGQVYYVHNQIHDIERVAEQINALVPEARVVVGHGQMKEQELEQIMMDFINHQADVLVCTTIIETGLDISNANTMIIDEADKMGLSQLYQLRGRVGRTNRIAYAYLTYKKDRSLSELAEKRLAAVREYTELGSGFKIAMRDLEIRGAGNLLGAEQHGQVTSVGFDLYCTLLDEAIRRLKGEKTVSNKEVEIDLQISAFIPEYYIKDSSVKLGFYQRIQRTYTHQKLMLLEEEMEDRFGDIPLETRNLLKVAELKVYCREAMIRAMKQKNGIIYFYFDADAQMEMNDLFLITEKYRRQLTYGNQSGELVLKLSIGSKACEECLDLVKDILLEITAIVHDANV